MQISSNPTSMPADLCVSTDKNGRSHCVVVVKGTFVIGPDGNARASEDQMPMVYADAHHGDPGTTSIKYECEFAPYKSATDIIVNGHAYSPTGRPVEEMYVGLEVKTVRKQVRVVGDRKWEGTAVNVHSSPPVPFVQMPLLFERAFGGSDHSHPDPKFQGTELRNPVGVGFHRNSEDWTIYGTPLPNLEDARFPMGSWSDTPPPVGFGFVGRGWQPRIKYAGTYNEEWMKTRFPFLPDDFSNRYFLAAPPDQQLPYLEGGELVRCVNMSPRGTFVFEVPTVRIPVLFRFRNGDIAAEPKLDTLIVEPSENRVLIVWRTSTPLGRKLNALREVLIGDSPATPGSKSVTKPHFDSLEDFVAWKRRGRPPIVQ